MARLTGSGERKSHRARAAAGAHVRHARRRRDLNFAVNESGRLKITSFVVDKFSRAGRKSAASRIPMNSLSCVWPTASVTLHAGSAGPRMARNGA